MGKLNPFRYRGYYYDEETSLYYLQSRYYDPATQRFINADDPNMLLADCYNPNVLYRWDYCNNNPVMFVDKDGYIAANVVGAVIGGVIGVIGGYVLTNWLANKLGLKGWKRNAFVWGLSAVITASTATIGYFVGPYVAKAWSSIKGKLASLISKNIKSIGKLSSNDLKHIIVSKHKWNKVMSKVTNDGVEKLIQQAVKKGPISITDKGLFKVTYKYKNQIIEVTGKIVKGVYRVGTAYVK